MIANVYSAREHFLRRMTTHFSQKKDRILMIVHITLRRTAAMSSRSDTNAATAGKGEINRWLTVMAACLATLTPPMAIAVDSNDLQRAEERCRADFSDRFRFINSVPSTAADACNCLKQRLNSDIEQKESAVDVCIGTVIKNHMTNYAQHKLESLLRDRGLDAVDRERFSSCFGSEFWELSKTIAEQGRRVGDADARSLLETCFARVKAVSDPSRRTR